MCVINAIFKNVGEDCTQQISDMSAYAKVWNNNGEGIFLSSGQKVVKNKERIPFYDLRRRIKDSEVVIQHSRLASSGFSEKFLHPFVSSRFVLFHNGVFCRTWKDNPPPKGKFWAMPKYEDLSDTSILFDKFTQLFKKTGDTRLSLARAIRYMKGGSYSIFLYDKLLRKTYYVKDQFTQMTAGKMSTGELVMSTDQRCFTYWEGTYQAIHIMPGVFYEIERGVLGWDLKNVSALYPIVSSGPFYRGAVKKVDEILDPAYKAVDLAFGRK